MPLADVIGGELHSSRCGRGQGNSLTEEYRHHQRACERRQ
jgi:hypothetical protein